MEIVLRTSAKLELSCAPKSPQFALNTDAAATLAPTAAPVDAPITLLECNGMYMYDEAACSSSH